MSNQIEENEEVFLGEIDKKLNTWATWWKFYMYMHYSLGVIGVVSSTLAASELSENSVKVFSLVSAMCFAIIGFVRPEAKYRNLVRAWGELKSARDAYLFRTDERADLLDALKESQRIATEDYMQTIDATKNQQSHNDVANNLGRTT